MVTLGSTLLLVEALRAHYTQLSRALHAYRGDSGSALDFDLNIDCAAWRVLDSGWEASDTGFDTAAGGDGGNGGGGE